MGVGGCGFLLLLLCLVVSGLAEAESDATDKIIRNRRDVHRIIIREQVAPRARGPQHHYWMPPPPPRGRVDGRHRGGHDSFEFSDEFEVKINKIFFKCKCKI